MICESEHDEHEIINYGKILIKDNDIIKSMKEIKNEFDKLENKIKESIEKLNIIKENIEKYYKIINDIINNYIKNKKRNYETLKNIREILDNNIINDIKKINNSNKYDDIMSIYNKINKKEEFILKSKINKIIEERNNIIEDYNISQPIEGKSVKEVNNKKPFYKLKEIYEFYKQFISKLFSLKDNKFSISSSIIDINKFDYISTFIVRQKDFQKYEKKLLFKEMEILSKIKVKEKYDTYEKKLASNFNFKLVSNDAKLNFFIQKA